MNHYDGYQNNTLRILSIMNFLNYGKIENYWRKSGIVYDLYHALEITIVSSIINKLLSDMFNEIEIYYIEKISFRDISEL